MRATIASIFNNLSTTLDHAARAVDDAFYTLAEDDRESPLNHTSINMEPPEVHTMRAEGTTAVIIRSEQSDSVSKHLSIDKQIHLLNHLLTEFLYHHKQDTHTLQKINSLLENIALIQQHSSFASLKPILSEYLNHLETAARTETEAARTGFATFITLLQARYNFLHEENQDRAQLDAQQLTCFTAIETAAQTQKTIIDHHKEKMKIWLNQAHILADQTSREKEAQLTLSTTAIARQREDLTNRYAAWFKQEKIFDQAANALIASANTAKNELLADSVEAFEWDFTERPPQS